jgi:nucleoside-diphosphate-sugar epimerase
MPQADLPETIRDEAQLDELLSEPTEAVLETLRPMDGDFVVLGAAGKMGPTLTRMIRRGLDLLGKTSRVIAVSRFSTSSAAEAFERHGIETIKADLLDPAQLDALPFASNVVYMAGMKFGATGQQPLTWAMNVYLPGMVCAKYRDSRIVAFSSGNVYGLSPVGKGGSRETDTPAPVGEYAMSILGRERILEHFSRATKIPISIIRLNYAVEMRYGVLHDLAMRVLTGEPIDLAMGHANVIWQGDASAMSIASFAQASSPPLVLNVAGPETFGVHEVAGELGKLLGVKPKFAGTERPTALLSDGGRARGLYGGPRVCLDQLVKWTASWVKQGGQSLGKPTHFENRAGDF